MTKKQIEENRIAWEKRRKEEKDHAVNTIYAWRKDLNIKATINKRGSVEVVCGEMERGKGK